MDTGAGFVLSGCCELFGSQYVWLFGLVLGWLAFEQFSIAVRTVFRSIFSENRRGRLAWPETGGRRVLGWLSRAAELPRECWWPFSRENQPFHLKPEPSPEQPSSFYLVP